MFRFCLLLAVAAVTVSASSWWIGLYSGVDPLDGGIITLSITQQENSEALNLRFSDTFIRACTNLPQLLPVGWTGDGPNDSKRGIYLANALDAGDILTSMDGNRSVPTQIFCFAGDNDGLLTPPGSPGVQVNANILWTFNRTGDFITMSGSLFAGQPTLHPSSGGNTAGGNITMRFHRISTDLGTSYIGIYQGVDPLDGGLITFSLSESFDGTGELNMRMSDTFVSACRRPTLLPTGFIAAGSEFFKRGIYLSDAVVFEDVLIDATTLSPLINWQIYCFAAPADTAHQPGVQVNIDVQWAFDRVNNALFMEGTLFTGKNSLIDKNGNNAAGGFTNMRFHKISQALEDSPASQLLPFFGISLLAVLFSLM